MTTLKGSRRRRSSESKGTGAAHAVELLQAAVESIEDPFFVCSAQPAAKGQAPALRIAFANPASELATRLDPSRVVGRDLVSVLAPRRGSLPRDRFHDFVRTGNPAPKRGPVRVDLWVTEPGQSSLRAARRLRTTDPDCRIVVFGSASDEWLALGARTVEREGGLVTMREALAHAIYAKL